MKSDKSVLKMTWYNMRVMPVWETLYASVVLWDITENYGSLVICGYLKKLTICVRLSVLLNKWKASLFVISIYVIKRSTQLAGYTFQVLCLFSALTSSGSFTQHHTAAGPYAAPWNKHHRDFPENRRFVLQSTGYLLNWRAPL